MNRHPFLRAYLAGIAVPTMFLLLVVTGFTVLRCMFSFPAPVERVVIFPMAVVPNLWGVWNMLHLRLRSWRSVPLGVHGAILPFLLAPAGGLVAAAVGIWPLVPVRIVLAAFPFGVIAYYLAWKYIVGFFNQVLGID